MDLSAFFPFWGALEDVQRARLTGAAREKQFEKGAEVHSGGDCVGLLLVKSGRLRVYFLSEEGKELTLYRLFAGDVCLFSAACMLRGVRFDVFVEAEQDTALISIPANVYEELASGIPAMANYTSELMARRFSDVMWLMEQALYKKLDMRLAALLLEESALAGGGRSLSVTHEQLAHHLGSAREVVTRMLRYFQEEGLVSLRRGGLEITDAGALRRLAESAAR